MLHIEMFGAPEPVCVPTPDVVLGSQIIDLALPNRLVEHLHVGVVADEGRIVSELAGSDVHLAAAEDHAVDVVEARTFAKRFDLREEHRRIGELRMRKLDEPLCWDELYLEPQYIAERAVGVREAVEQVGVLRRRAGDRTAITQ